MLNAEIVALEEQEAKIMAEGFVQNVYNDLNDIKHSFFVIGFRLTEANNLKYYKALGYQNITELAEDKFGFKKTVTYELMQIYALAHNTQSPMRIADKYDKYSKSQLAEFCRLRYCHDEFIQIVTPQDNVDTIGRAVTFWNKYIAKHSGSPTANAEIASITDLLLIDIETPLSKVQRVIEQRKAAQQSGESNSANAEKSSVSAGQLPGQTVIDISAVQNVEEFNAVGNFSGNPEKTEVVDEPETTPAALELTDGELIDYCLKRRMVTIKKFEIYTKFNESPNRNEFINFITDLYGIGEYHSPVINFNYGPKIGIIISRKNNSKIELPWTYVTGRISRLIELNEYLSADEQAAYIEWKASRDGLVVNVEPAAEPAPKITKPPIEIGKKTNWEYLQTCNTRANFLFVVTQGVKSMPEDFGAGMPDRIYKWLQIWLEKPVAL